MAWCHQVRSYCLIQCWPRSMLPYGITRPPCKDILNILHTKILYHFLTVTPSPWLWLSHPNHSISIWRLYFRYWIPIIKIRLFLSLFLITTYPILTIPLLQYKEDNYKIVFLQYDGISRIDETSKRLTCWIVLKIMKDVLPFLSVSLILFDMIRPNSQWSNPTCRLSYTDNTMPACWCSGDFKSQGISRHCIYQKSWNIPSLPSQELVLK